MYRFNSSLNTLDSLLKIQTLGSYTDTSFNNSYGKAGVFTLNQLLFAAVNNNPQLAAMQTKIDASNFQAEEKTYLPDPMVEFELDDIMTDFKKVGMINFYFLLEPATAELVEHTVERDEHLIRHVMDIFTRGVLK